MRLQDKVILVTASTRGIGLAIVKKCTQEGARVYMAARDMERAQEIANSMNGVKCVYRYNRILAGKGQPQGCDRLCGKPGQNHRSKVSGR